MIIREFSHVILRDYLCFYSFFLNGQAEFVYKNHLTLEDLIVRSLFKLKGISNFEAKPLYFYVFILL